MTAATLVAGTNRQSKIGAVLRVTSGNFLEQFDFFLFGFYATYIAKTFFPAQSEFASLILTFSAFGAGFLMRPLGAIVLGAYIDKVGRRKGLIYLAEMATPGHKGFYTSWQSASQQVAIVISAGLGYALNRWMTADDINAWGWRIPFFVGCAIVPVIFVLRRSLLETEEFKARTHHPSTREVFRSMAENWSVVLQGMLLVAMTTTTFYLITVYTPTFGRTVLKLSAADSLIVSPLTLVD